MDKFLIDAEFDYKKCENSIEKIINYKPPKVYNPWLLLCPISRPRIMSEAFCTGAKMIGEGLEQVSSYCEKNWKEKGWIYRTVKATGALVSAVAGVATLVGAVVGTGVTAGLGAPATVLIGTYAANQAISGFADFYNAVFGDVDKIGEVDVLKSGISAVTGEVGSWFGNEDAGEKVGEVIYSIGSVATTVISVKNSFSKLSEAKSSASTFKGCLKNAKDMVSKAAKEIPKAIGEVGYFLCDVPVERLALEAKLLSYTIPNIMDVVSDISLINKSVEGAMKVINGGIKVIETIAEIDVQKPAYLETAETFYDGVDFINSWKSIDKSTDGITNNFKVVKIV